MNSQRNPEKEGGVICPDLKLSSGAIIIKTVWCCIYGIDT